MKQYGRHYFRDSQTGTRLVVGPLDVQDQKTSRQDIRRQTGLNPVSVVLRVVDDQT